MHTSTHSTCKHEVQLYNSLSVELEVTIEPDGEVLAIPPGGSVRFVAEGTDPSTSFGVELRDDSAVVYLPIKIKKAAAFNEDRVVWQI